MMCSKESAYILLEVCNNSLEESERRLTLFFHLDEFLEGSDLIEKLKSLCDWTWFRGFLDEVERNNLGNLFEAVTNFIAYLGHIRVNPQIVSNQSVAREIETNVSKAENLLQKMIQKNPNYFHLYQTQKVAREVLFTQIKKVEEYQKNGVISHEEAREFLREIQ